MKILVVHPLQQHSYYLAAAIKKCNCLEKYMTCVYLKRWSFTNIACSILRNDSKKRASNRKCKELSDQDVIIYYEILGLLRLFCQNIKAFNKYESKIRAFLYNLFANKVARYAINHKVDMVISFDNCSSKLFSILEKKAPQIIRVLDTSAANPLYMKEIYSKDVLLAPNFSDYLKKECPHVWDDKLLLLNKNEIKLSHYFLSPSSFVDKSLIFSGIKSQQIFKVPYGLDLKLYTKKSNYKYEVNCPLKLIYVGGVKEIKGIYYLLEAVNRYTKDQITLTVVGNYDKNDTHLEKYRTNVTFTGLVLHDKVSLLLKEADVFVFPSLGDSFAFSVLEAAATGLPLIVSENTGMSDQIINGEEGFIIPVQSIDAICDKIDWFLINRDKIEAMGLKAREMALQMTWSKYQSNIHTFINSIAERSF